MIESKADQPLILSYVAPVIETLLNKACLIHEPTI